MRSSRLWPAGILPILFLVASLAGCGSNSAPTAGRITLRVNPAGASRVIPSGTQSIEALVSSEGQWHKTAAVAYSAATTSPVSLTIADVPVGQVFVTVAAYDGPVTTASSGATIASGTPLARATQTVDVVAGRDTVVSATLSGVVSTIAVTPNTASVPVGSTITLTATARDAAGNTVLVAAGRIVWETSDTGMATVDANGVVTGVAPGSVTITARDTETGRTGAAIVTVTNGLIAFTSMRDGNEEIYAMGADGASQTRLTNDPAVDWGAAWSPDQARIAFFSNRSGQPDLYVMGGDGSNPVRLTTTGVASGMYATPCWSPDGTRIAFASGAGFLSFINADGSNLVTSGITLGYDSSVSWSPDGTRILFDADLDTGGAGPYEVCVVNVDGSGLAVLANSGNGDDGPAWSPNGSRIAFASARDGQFEVYVMNSDGSGQTRLTTLGGYGPAWSADGGRIAFSTNRDGNEEIYVMNADASAQTRLTNITATDEAPAWR